MNPGDKVIVLLPTLCCRSVYDFGEVHTLVEPLVAPLGSVIAVTCGACGDRAVDNGRFLYTRSAKAIERSRVRRLLEPQEFLP